jgi:hypothetical protein
VAVSEPEVSEEVKETTERAEAQEVKDVLEEKQSEYVDAVWEHVVPDEFSHGDKVEKDIKEEGSIGKDLGTSEDRGIKPEEDAKTGENKGGGCTSNPLPRRIEILLLVLVVLALGMRKGGVR